MDLSEIRLPGIVIADLYKSMMVAVQAPELQQAEVPPAGIQQAEKADTSSVPALQFLGKNLKQVMVLVNYPREVHLPGEQLAFLSNVLKACNLTPDDIAIVNTARQPVPLHELTRQLRPSCMLLFGAPPADLRLPDHFTVSGTDGIALMSAPELDTLNRNDAEGRLLKSKLWLALKQLFKV